MIAKLPSFLKKTVQFIKKNSQVTKPLLIGFFSILLSGLMVSYAKNNPQFIEKYYTRGFFKGLSTILNNVSGAFPFSVGEVFIGLEIMLVLYFVYRCIKNFIKRDLLVGVRQIALIFCLLSLNLLVYQLFWGLNNYRLSVEELFELEDMTITKDLLYDSYEYLVEEANELREDLPLDEVTTREVRMNAYAGYEGLEEDYEFVWGGMVKVKPLMISPIFTRSGYTGIYLPFFSEANINYMPVTVGLGFTASHEIAHLKGFAGEDEANFMGYLSSMYHYDDFYKYSATLAMLSYVGNDLYKADKERYSEAASKRSELVISDILAKNEFWEENIVESTKEFHDDINDAFLKANNQPDGIINYNKVVELFVKGYVKGLYDIEEN